MYKNTDNCPLVTVTRFTWLVGLSPEVLKTTCINMHEFECFFLPHIHIYLCPLVFISSVIKVCTLKKVLGALTVLVTSVHS